MQYLRELFGYNAGFADEIIKSLRTIDRTSFIEEKVCAWGSLRNLVLHLIEVQDYWINKIIQGREFKQYDFDDFNEIDIIEKKWKDVEADIILFLGNLTPDDYKREIRVKWDKEYTYSLEKVLQHVYTHTVHHRGQVVAAISALGGKAPYVDII